MKEEMTLMDKNLVWDLVILLEGVKAIRCTWVYETEKDLVELKSTRLDLLP